MSSQFPIQIVIRIQMLVCLIDLHSSHQQFLLPLLIEKLDSDVQSAKVDSMQTLVKHPSDHHDCPSDGTKIRVSYKHYKLIPISHLFVFLLKAACAPVYGHKELAEFLPGLWSSIRREVIKQFVAEYSKHCFAHVCLSRITILW